VGLGGGGGWGVPVGVYELWGGIPVG